MSSGDGGAFRRADAEEPTSSRDRAPESPRTRCAGICDHPTAVPSDDLPTAELLTLHVMRYAASSAPRAVWVAHRRGDKLRATPGLLRAQLCATSNTVLPTPGRLALLCAWKDPASAECFLNTSPVLRWMTADAQRTSHVTLKAMRATGRWHGIAVATDDCPPLTDVEPVLAFVHGRLRPRHAARFFRTNVSVARFARRQPGLLGAIGIHESPLRFASLSRWRSLAALQSYAYGPGAHQPVVQPYKQVPWAVDWCFLRLRAYGSTDFLR